MMDWEGWNLGAWLAALGGGLLVGIERERRKGEGPNRDAVGLRTCIVVALLGALSATLGTPALFVAGIATVVLVALSYRRTREHDPGLTTEFAVVALFFLGALAMSHTAVAAALFVVLAIVLASKQSLHRIARSVLTEQEVNDLLLLAAAVLIILPLLPDRTIDPLGVLNPRTLWLYAVLVMSITAAGYIALRVLGPRHGLALAGFFGGFVSSTATIAGMAQRAREDPALAGACAGAALISNVATVAQLALILSAVSLALLGTFSVALIAAAAVAIVTSALALWASRGTTVVSGRASYGRPFSPLHALLFALIVAAALTAAAWLVQRLGPSGAFVAAAATGLADVHAAAVGIADLTANGGLATRAGSFALAIAFLANSLMKCLAASTGGRAFALPVIGGIVAINIGLGLALLLI